VHQFTYQSGTDLVATVSSPDTVSLAYTYTGPLLKRETWSGNVSGYVERTHDADFHVWRETVNGAWPAYFEHDADGLLTRAGALVLTRRASDGLVSATSVGVVTSAMSYASHGELWRLRSLARTVGLHAPRLREIVRLPLGSPRHTPSVQEDDFS